MGFFHNTLEISSTRKISDANVTRVNNLIFTEAFTGPLYEHMLKNHSGVVKYIICCCAEIAISHAFVARIHIR